MEVLAAEPKSSYSSQAHSSVPPCLQIKSACQYKEKKTKPEVTFSEVKCPCFRDVLYKINLEVNEVEVAHSSFLLDSIQRNF